MKTELDLLLERKAEAALRSSWRSLTVRREEAADLLESSPPDSESQSAAD